MISEQEMQQDYGETVWDDYDWYPEDQEDLID